jgi:dihydrofolate reductase
MHRMARIVGYIATTLDGFIATPNDTLEWLTRYDPDQFGYKEFIRTIRTVVMGRSTYDYVDRESPDWLYKDKRSIVVTSRPVTNPKGEIEIWRDSIEALVAMLRSLDDGDVWMIGGGKLQMAFMERGALDEIEIYVMPELIGGGVPLFPPTGFRATPTLVSAEAKSEGVVRLQYRFN